VREIEYFHLKYTFAAAFVSAPEATAAIPHKHHRPPTPATDTAYPGNPTTSFRLSIS